MRNEKKNDAAIIMYLQFEIHCSALHAFLTAGRGIDSQAFPAGLFVPCQTHFSNRYLLPRPSHGAIHCEKVKNKINL